MAEQQTVVLIGTLDTKGAEYAFLVERLRAAEGVIGRVGRGGLRRHRLRFRVLTAAGERPPDAEGGELAGAEEEPSLLAPFDVGGVAEEGDEDLLDRVVDVGLGHAEAPERSPDEGVLRVHHRADPLAVIGVVAGGHRSCSQGSRPVL